MDDALQAIWMSKQFPQDNFWESLAKGIAAATGRPAPPSRGDRLRQQLNDQLAIDNAIRQRELWRREDEKYKYEQSILPPAADIKAEIGRAHV